MDQNEKYLSEQLSLLIQKLRHEVCSIDLSDIRSVDQHVPSKADTLSKEERSSYVASAAGFFQLYLKPEAERLLYAQEKFMNEKAENWFQMLVGRGTINGILLLYELFQEYEKEVRAPAQERASEEQPESEVEDEPEEE